MMIDGGQKIDAEISTLDAAVCEVRREPEEGTLEHLGRLIERSFHVRGAEIHPGSVAITETLSIYPIDGARVIEFRISVRRDAYEVWQHAWNQWTPVRDGAHLFEIMDLFGFARKEMGRESTEVPR